MASGLPTTGDPSSSSLSKSGAGSSSQDIVSDSETAPLLPRVSDAPELSAACRNYGATQSGLKAKLSQYEIPFWQNQPMWSTGLFDCCADMPMCCFTMFFPCLAFGWNAQALDESKNSCWTAATAWWVLQHTIALGCLYSASYRGKLRSKYNIPEGPFSDSLIHCLCWPCAFCQEYRELHYRSFGPESWGQSFTIPPAEQRFLSSERKDPEMLGKKFRKSKKALRK
ncbi:protein PLANT CADMIUM RESISTANCE 7 isoform X1 [Physcomitrium patens]|uniref:Uncharacterized protein n=1 Tax=Physcomitrium patens TaxID=3218 RepID=A0A2K1K2N2_PHYPA|nr:protein PLANT CADMIUM RESISTANCE 9-like isoform X1 [Physcomitrium patens]PNR48037.1 hypothetical protein PHYPA_012510 [Physcomitrium patens]|eukprot:XP_024383754.1 protein PLANT CADMIUM RESISTANCE 9-like isoform X1 [Physcomitrella patens]